MLFNAEAVLKNCSARAAKRRASFGWAQFGREFPWVHAQLRAFLFSSLPGGPLPAGLGSFCLGLAWLPGAPLGSARWRRAPSGAGECPGRGRTCGAPRRRPPPSPSQRRASFGWAQPGREFPWVHAQLGAFLFSSPPGGPLAAGRGSVCLGLAWLPGAPLTSARWRRAPSGAGECPEDLAIAEIAFSN